MKDKKEVIRFLIAGAIANATDYGLYFFLFHFLSFNMSKGISFTCAGIVGYWLNKYWALKHDQPSSYPEVGRYTLIIFLALVINVLINKMVLDVWPGAVFGALITASTASGLFAFIYFKGWVFRIFLKKGGV
jgi:putative flippase GtrA